MAFLLGCAETVYDSAARAMLSGVVTRCQLERGNSLLTTSESVGNIFLGAPIGAWLFAVAASLPLWANSGAYLCAAFLALTVAGSFAVDRSSGSSMREDMVEGLRWLAHHRLLRELMAITGFGAAVHSMTQGILVLYALQNLGLDERGFGLALAVTGVGAIVGAMLSPTVTRLVGRTNAMGAAQTLSAIAILLMAFWQHPVGGPLLYAVSAGAISMFNVQIMSVRQALIPEHLFGRVQGAYRTVIWGGIPIGMLAGGALGGWLGLPAVFVVCGPRRHRRRLDHLGDPALPPARDQRGVRPGLSAFRSPESAVVAALDAVSRVEIMTSDGARLLDGADWPGNIYVEGTWRPARRVTPRSSSPPPARRSVAPVAPASTTSPRQRPRRPGRSRSGRRCRTPQRAAVLRKAGDLFGQHADELAEWNVREVGAVRGMAGFALHVAAEECYAASGLPSAPLGELIPSEEPRLSMAKRVPVGVVGVISPFNVPLILSIRSVAPALALGNAVLLKPDPRTVMTGGVNIVRVFEEAGPASRRTPAGAGRRRRRRGDGQRPERARHLLHRVDGGRVGRSASSPGGT